MTSLRSILTALVCLVLVVTAQAAAFARGQAPAEGRHVICAGLSVLVVYVDGNGQPTSAPELCADAAQALLSPLLVAVAPLPRMLAFERASFATAPLFTTHLTQKGFSARAPPSDV